MRVRSTMRSMVRGTSTALLLATFAITGTLVGCGGDDGDPNVAVIRANKSSRAVGEAIGKLRRDRNPKLIKQLGDAWQQDGNFKSEVLTLLIATADQRDRGTLTKEQFASDYEDYEGDKDAVMQRRLESEKEVTYGPFFREGPFWPMAIPYLTKALEKFAEDPDKELFGANALAAAEAFEEIKSCQKEFADRDPDKRCGDPDPAPLIAVAKLPILSLDAKSKIIRTAKLRAVVALGSFGDNPQVVDALLGMLKKERALSEMSNPVVRKVNNGIVRALAESGSEKALDTLLTGMFKIPGIRVNAQSALISMGSVVEPELLKAFDGKNKSLQAWLTRNPCPKTRAPTKPCLYPGSIQYGIAESMGYFPGKRVSKRLAAALDEPGLRINLGDGVNFMTHDYGILTALQIIGDTSKAGAVWKHHNKKSTSEAVKNLALDVYSRLETSDKNLGKLSANLKGTSSDKKTDPSSLGKLDTTMMAYSRIYRGKSKIAEFKKAAGANKKTADKIMAAVEDAKEKLKPLEKERREAQGAFEKCQREEMKKWKELDAKKPKKKDKDGKVIKNKPPSPFPACKTKQKKFNEVDGRYLEKEGANQRKEQDALHFRWRQLLFEKAFVSVAIATECKNDVKCLASWVADDTPKHRKKLEGLAEKYKLYPKSTKAPKKKGAKNDGHKLFASSRKPEEGKMIVIAAQERALLDLAKMGDKAASARNAILDVIKLKTSLQLRLVALHALRATSPAKCADCAKVLARTVESQKSDKTMGPHTQWTRKYKYYFQAGLKQK